MLSFAGEVGVGNIVGVTGFESSLRIDHLSPITNEVSRSAGTTALDFTLKGCLTVPGSSLALVPESEDFASVLKNR